VPFLLIRYGEAIRTNPRFQANRVVVLLPTFCVDHETPPFFLERVE
jgi:hypothetical protein